MAKSAREVLLTITNTLKLATVEPYLFLIMFGYAVRIISFQDLLKDSACRNLHMFDDDICDQLHLHDYHKEKSIEAGNNLYSGVMLLGTLPSVIIAVFVGPWSDKYGRKYPMMIAAAGVTLEGATSAALSYAPDVSPVWYVVASVFAGFSGGIVTSASSAFSYMSDVTDERSRAGRYAVLEFGVMFATTLGSIVGGLIYKEGGYGSVMVLGPCSSGIALLYVLFLVKDTKPKVEGQTFGDKARDLFTLENIKDSYRTCSKKRPGNIRLQIWLMIFAGSITKFVEMGTLAIAYPFAVQLFDWDVTDFSHASTAFSVMAAFVTLVIIPILANKLRLHEAALGLIGMLSMTAKMVIFSVSYYQILFYYAWLCGALRTCTGIAIRSRLSKLVHRNEVGRVFSLVGTCEAVTPLLGTLVFVQIYNASASIFPGMAFAASAVLLVPGLVIFSWMMSLSTVSFGEFEQDETPTALETYSSNYTTLKEENI